MGELIGLLHDIGKYSSEFQTYIRSAAGNINPDEDDYVDYKQKKGKIDHSTAGAQVLWKELKGKGLGCELASQIAALCITSHHSGMINCLAPDGTDVFTKRMKKVEDRSHLDEVHEKMDEVIRKRVDELLVSPLIEQELMSGLHRLFNGESSKQIREAKLGLFVRMLFSALIDADRLSSADFESPAMARSRLAGAYRGWPLLIQEMEQHIAGLKQGNPIDKIRTNISQACLDFAEREKGLYRLTVPTGGGKTLASLRFALHHANKYGMDRIIYVIPYTSIIDQNAERVRAVFEKKGGNVVLEHHSNLKPERDTWQAKILAENWDSPVVFTTTVQFLEALLGGGTRGVRRMHQLANSVIIFDEVQTIPVKTVHLFNNAINFLVQQCEATILFCTATQPLLNEVDIQKGAAKFNADAEVISNVEGLFRELHRVQMVDVRKNEGWTEDEVAHAASQEMEDAGSVLVVVNTKRAAQEIFKRCRGYAERAFHLSTYMCPAHRMQVLKEVEACLDPDNPVPVICISTQLIEAGVDIDFGSVIRYLAGLDSVAQAAGRCNRHGRRQTGRVLVVNPADENLSMLPEIRTAKEKAERVLDEYRKDPARFDNDLLGPKAMSQFYRYYYFDRAHEMDYPVSRNMMDRDDTLLSLLSTNTKSLSAYRRISKGCPLRLVLRQSFKTAGDVFKAIDAPTQGVVVPYGEEGKSLIAELCSATFIEKRFDLLKKAQRYSVNLFPRVFKTLSENGCIHEAQEGSGIMYLEKRYYSPDFGVSVNEVAEMELLNE
jgi:CRISPR-associated endonuclease/helicase Cas3